MHHTLDWVEFFSDVVMIILKELLSAFSWALSKAEKNYSVTNIELAAVVFALQRFRPIILQQPFILFTHHSALLPLFKTKFNL